MNSNIKDFCQRLEKGVDSVRHLTKNFREALDITAFAYVRVYHDGKVSWVSSDSDQDRLLIDVGALESDPLIDKAQLLKEGKYLWFHNREFSGCEEFYRIRSQNFKLDHGLVIVNHQKDYLETGSFSGLLAQKPLYNLFINETGLFRSLLEHFKSSLDKTLIAILENGLRIDNIKSPQRKCYEHLSSDIRSKLIISLGFSNFLKLSTRERECLELLDQNLTYQEIGNRLKLSVRTIEHYFDTIRNKLDIYSRAELHYAAQKFCELGIKDLQK